MEIEKYFAEQIKETSALIDETSKRLYEALKEKCETFGQLASLICRCSYSRELKDINSDNIRLIVDNMHRLYDEDLKKLNTHAIHNK